MKNITELIKTKYPVIQGGMAHIADANLAAAVSNAGGLGLIAASDNDPTWVKEQIDKCRQLTDKPFGVNIMLMNPNSPKIAQLLIDEKIAVITTGAGNPAPYIPAWKAANITVIPVVPSVALAQRMEKSGADAIIVEGCEAGGHIGLSTTMTLVPQVVDAISIPVIAAGGIADQRGVLACFALGAKGVQIGTLILASNECMVHDNYKQLIIAANDNSTIITGFDAKTRVRALKSKLTLDYLQNVKNEQDFSQFEKELLGSLKKAVSGDLEHGSFMAGQIAGLIKEVKPIKQILSELFDNIEQSKNNLKII